MINYKPTEKQQNIINNINSESDAREYCLLMIRSYVLNNSSEQIIENLKYGNSLDPIKEVIYIILYFAKGKIVINFLLQTYLI